MIWYFDTMNEADMDPILAIEQKSFNRPWRRISFEKELSYQYGCNLIVRCHHSIIREQVIAYLFVRSIENELHILKIAVAPRWRCQGVATRLMSECLKRAREWGLTEAFLEVRPSNQTAIKLYRKFGFKIIGKRTHYYTDTGEDALVMKKILREGLAPPI